MQIEHRATHNLRSIQQRVKFLSSLIYDPKFYRIINTVISDPSKLDCTLGTLCYFTLLVGAVLNRYPQWKVVLQKLWSRILSLRHKLLSKVWGKTQPKPSSEPLKTPEAETEKVCKYEESQKSMAEGLERMEKILKQFSGYITDIRIFNRGFSIPSCIADVLEAGSLLQKKDYLGFVSTWCISLYQPLETIAFLFDHNWLLPGRERNNCNWWYAISTRFWFAWVVAEFSQLTYKLFITKRGKNVDKEELIAFIEHLATLPLCVHWSLEDGCLDDLKVGLLGTIAGGLSTFDIWRGTWGTILKECR